MSYDLTPITGGWPLLYRLHLLGRMWARAVYKAYKKRWRRRWMAKRARLMMTHRVVATVDQKALTGLIDALHVQTNANYSHLRAVQMIPDGGYELGQWDAMIAHYGKPLLGRQDDQRGRMS